MEAGAGADTLTPAAPTRPRVAACVCMPVCELTCVPAVREGSRAIGMSRGEKKAAAAAEAERVAATMRHCLRAVVLWQLAHQPQRSFRRAGDTGNEGRGAMGRAGEKGQWGAAMERTCKGDRQHTSCVTAPHSSMKIDTLLIAGRQARGEWLYDQRGACQG